MPHELIPLADWFRESEWPALPCGACEKGHLAPRTIVTVEGAQSARLRDHEGWEPEWISGSFHGELVCGIANCEEPAVVLGEMKVDAVVLPGGHWYGDFDTYLKVRAVSPPLPLMKYPSGTPEAVQDRVAGASQVLWAQPSAAANRLRSAVEELLTAKKVRKTASVPKKGSAGGRKTRRLTSHERIALLRADHPVAADALEAVKWIGNEGSHEETLTVDDVLQGIQLLERAIELLYDTTDAELRRLAERINKRRGIGRSK